MSVDLNINNYNFEELSSIFKINSTLDIEENEEKIENVLKVVKEKYGQEIYSFYLKASKIILSIYKLFENNVILDIEDESKVAPFIKKIKKTNNYEFLNVDDIVSPFFSEYEFTQRKQLQSDMPTRVSNQLQPGFNSEFMTNTKNIVSLNNKNITNNVIDSFPNSLSAGYLNSIKRISQIQHLNLNSAFRTNYSTTSSTNFQYIIPAEIKNVVSMSLCSIEIPNAWYLFSASSGNNQFNVTTFTNANGLNTYTLVIPDGNYGASCLVTYLNNNFFYNSGINSDLQYIAFSIDPYNFKSTFSVSGSSGPNPLIPAVPPIPPPGEFFFSLVFQVPIGQNPMNTLGWYIGFRKEIYLDITNSITSEGLFDAGGDRYIYFCLNDYQNNKNIEHIVGLEYSLLNEDILAKIPMTNGKLCLIVDVTNEQAKTRIYNGPVNLNRLQIQILDKFGNVINLNNMDFSFSLELQILYESFNFKDVFA
jgi:hypothetical protein